MDLMNSDFSDEDLTEVLTSAWKCSQPSDDDFNPPSLAEETTKTTHVPEVVKSQNPARASIGAFTRSVRILTERNVRAVRYLTQIRY
jgi:hypothetical protein